MLVALLLLHMLHAGEIVTEDAEPTHTVKPPRCLDLKPPIKSSAVPGDDTDIAARLIYAETKAANCPTLNARLLAPIASVVLNRVRAFGEKPNAYRRVIFGRSQFASSLHDYKQSHWQDFACPKDDELFEQARAALERLRNGEVKIKSPSATHYYLHRHFGAYRPHPWGKKARATETIEDCLGLYEVDRALLSAPML